MSQPGYVRVIRVIRVIGVIRVIRVIMDYEWIGCVILYIYICIYTY